ncbi:hypothetical protein QYE76_015636 [Lolium multiflorum]|uniref:F-box domain-containing protein n=1 Tax=Lolium multiflorum TaxID=4521 RepID=A0AAD8U8G9_LOLMU|nr:hypothetical protein QYE76_015636 [Lolium multiflorum]
MAESTTTTPSDDVVGEILLRLDDVATLFRCTTTCKRWRRLVAKPSFILRRQWPPSLVAFFTRRCLGGGAGTDSSTRLACVPWPGSSVLTRPRALSSFLRADDAAAAAAVDAATPLATRGGLLLVRLYLRLREDDLKPKTFSLAPVCNPIVGLAVCNPFAGTWDVLPELDCESRLDGRSDEYGCDIVPGDGSSAFKVLMIGKDKEKPQFNLHIFSSGEASWRAPTKCFDMMERQIWSLENTNAVVCRGYAHWLFLSKSDRFHVLNVDVETGHVSLTKPLGPTKDWTPAPVVTEYPDDNIGNDGNLVLDYRHLGRATHRTLYYNLYDADHLATTTDGGLLSLLVYSGRRLEIWTQQHYTTEDGDVDWRKTRVIDQNLTELIIHLKRPSCIWSGERSETLLIKEGRDRLYIAHLDTGKLEEATDQFLSPAHHGIIMPIEIDWPTFFMSRLGGSY